MELAAAIGLRVLALADESGHHACDLEANIGTCERKDLTMAAVNYELVDNIAVIDLDDGKANAISPSFIQSMHECFDRAEAEAAAVAFFGRENRLSAGFDLGIMMSGPEAMRELVIDGAEMLMRMYTLPRPIVGGCTGHALAAGAMLLLASDYRVGMAGPFKIGLNEVAIQMTLPSFGVDLARDRISKRHYTQVVTQARIYDPETALDAGFLDEIVAPEDLRAKTLEHAKRLAALPQPAFHGTKLKERGATVEKIRAELRPDLEKLTMG